MRERGKEREREREREGEGYSESERVGSKIELLNQKHGRRNGQGGCYKHERSKVPFQLPPALKFQASKGDRS